MKQSGWWRLRRHVIWAVVVGLCAVLLSTAAIASVWTPRLVGSPDGSATAARTVSTLADARTATTIRGFQTRAATITLGSQVEDDVVVVPRARRVVLVQARPPGSSRYVTQSQGSSSAKGRFHAVYRPTTGGAWRFRLVVRSTQSSRSTTSASRVVTVVDKTAPRSATQLAVSGVSLDRATLTWVNPGDQDFTGVLVRRALGTKAPGSPTQGTRVAEAGRQVTQLTDTGLAADTEYSYAVFAHDGSSNFARAATVTLRTSRGGVSGLEATSVSRTDVDLAWTNPTDDSFTGAVVRRAVGATAPASVADGTDVGDVLAPESILADSGLAPDTQYTYAVFAHDGAGHVAAAATVTIQTRPAGTFAVLSVNPILPRGVGATAGTSVAFDASQSLAAEGRDLTSWSLDYGDGSPVEAFTGPFGAADVLNTTHTFSNTGTRTVTLTVTDSDGDTATDIVPVQVFDPPEVSLSMTTSSPQDGVPVPFEVKAETPQGTAVTSYEMAVSGDDSFFIDGVGAPPGSVDVTFASGTYTVFFIVTNDAGGTGVSDPVVVEVP